MTQATPRDYYISPNALHIELNAMGNSDYIHASCHSGAQVTVHIKDVIEYDGAHNYRRYALDAWPTVFNTTEQKYVYLAIPHNIAAPRAYLVFPSELLDIYGYNEQGEHIGEPAYYYIYLGGCISPSLNEDGIPVQRTWLSAIDYGMLSSDEDISSGADATIYQLDVTPTIVNFSRDKDNNLVPRGVVLSARIKKIQGETVEYPSLELPYRIKWTYGGLDFWGETLSITNKIEQTAINVQLLYNEDIVFSQDIPIVKDGSNGIQGQDAFLLSLDNEIDSIPLTYDSKVAGDNTNIVVSARLYKGTKVVPASLPPTASLQLYGVDPIITVSDKNVVRIEWQFAKGTLISSTSDRVSLPISLIYDDVTYNATFTCNLIRASKPGESPSVYNLRITPASAVFNRDDKGINLIPVSRTLIAVVIEHVGNKVRELPLPFTMSIKWYIDGQATPVHTGTTYTVLNTTTTSQVRCALLEGDTILDVENIPVLKDGKRGVGLSANIKNERLVIIDDDGNEKVLEDVPFISADNETIIWGGGKRMKPAKEEDLEDAEEAMANAANDMDMHVESYTTEFRQTAQEIGLMAEHALDGVTQARAEFNVRADQITSKVNSLDKNLGELGTEIKQTASRVGAVVTEDGDVKGDVFLKLIVDLKTGRLLSHFSVTADQVRMSTGVDIEQAMADYELAHARAFNSMDIDISNLDSALLAQKDRIGMIVTEDGKVRGAVILSQIVETDAQGNPVVDKDGNYKFKSNLLLNADQMQLIADKISIIVPTLELNADKITSGTGKFNFAGTLVAPEGNIGGWTIAKENNKSFLKAVDGTHVIELSPERLLFRSGLTQKILLDRKGSGMVASNSISWDEDGKVKLKPDSVLVDDGSGTGKRLWFSGTKITKEDFELGFKEEWNNKADSADLPQLSADGKNITFKGGKSFSISASDINTLLAGTYGVSFETGGKIKLGLKAGTETTLSPVDIYSCDNYQCGTYKWGAASSPSSPSSGDKTSDITLKQVLNDVQLPLDDIADAPVFNYHLKADESKHTYLGTSAQYWVDKVNGVVEGKKGSYSMHYDTLALAAVVSLAREIRELKDEIKRLRGEM